MPSRPATQGQSVTTLSIIIAEQPLTPAVSVTVSTFLAGKLHACISSPSQGPDRSLPPHDKCRRPGTSTGRCSSSDWQLLLVEAAAVPCQCLLHHALRLRRDAPLEPVSAWEVGAWGGVCLSSEPPTGDGISRLFRGSGTALSSSPIIASPYS